MYFQYLIEDLSSAALINILMDKITALHPDVEYDCKSFQGLGGYGKKNTAKEIKTGKLLNDLAIYLRGFNKSLQAPDYPAAVIVVLDNDDRNTEEFRDELENVAKQNMIVVDHVFCIAVEEIEAWLLGDENAILSAYPRAKTQILHSYIQDSICGTWEFLANVIYPGGYQKLDKEHPTYQEKGKLKSEWATNIGKYMNLSGNKSPSFNYFISEINKRLVS